MEIFQNYGTPSEDKTFCTVGKINQTSSLTITRHTFVDDLVACIDNRHSKFEQSTWIWALLSATDWKYIVY